MFVMRFLQTFSGTFGIAIAFWVFELWGGNPKRIPSLFFLVISGFLALSACLRFFDESFKKTPLSVGALPSIVIFIISAVSIRRGWFGFNVDLERPGFVGQWLLIMIGVQIALIIIYKGVFKTIYTVVFKTKVEWH